MRSNKKSILKQQRSDIMTDNKKHASLTEQHKDDGEKNERLGTTNPIALDGEVTNQEKSSENGR